MTASGEPISAVDVLAFWRAAGPAKWFKKDAAFDAEIARRFSALWQEAAASALPPGEDTPEGALGLVILLDQFPRNMFRGSPRAFATDAPALDAARHAVEQGYDRAMLPVERLFAYLPFEHSETLADQIKACALCKPLEAFEETDDAYRYAVRHREIIEFTARKICKDLDVPMP